MSGADVWSWADALSKQTQRAHRIRELRDDLFKAERRCGSCQHWMKSRKCPRERNVDGMSRGPSGDSLKCPQFVMTAASADLQAKWSSELSALLTDTQQGAET